MSATWAWLWLIGLGAYHGINPGMGWLFAVALGLQEKRRAAVWKSLLPIALGHALSIGVVVAAVLLLDAQIPTSAVRVAAAVLLFGFGGYRLLSSRHPRWGGMRVGWRDLTIWSFVMASAHGAGLMLIPVLLELPQERPQDPSAAALTQPHAPPAAAAPHEHAKVHEHGSNGGHGEHVGPLRAAARGTAALGILAVAVHTLAYLVVTAAVAALVYEKLGLALLQRAWWNLDAIWAVALIVTGAATLLAPLL